MDAEELKRLRELEAKATPGPWEWREDGDYYQFGDYCGVGPYHYIDGEQVDGRHPKGHTGSTYFANDIFKDVGRDGDFIVAMRSALPELLDMADHGLVVMKLRGECERLYCEADRWKAKALEMAKELVDQVEEKVCCDGKWLSHSEGCHVPEIRAKARKLLEEHGDLR